MVVGLGGSDFIKKFAGNVIHFINRRPTPCTAPCDGWVLKMHYQWTFWLFLAGFTAIWQSWYHKDVIVCTSKFNAESQVRVDYLNICLSYPYVETPTGKQYLMFFRWIHWAMLTMAGLYYLVRKLSKNLENAKVKRLFEDLVPNIFKYDFSGDGIERASRYLTFNSGGHDSLFYKYLICNIFALILDIAAFFMLDFCLNNKFLNLGFAFPFHRDAWTFSDPLSKAFPPFVRCELSSKTELTSQRGEKFGCHLTVMELYEKFFVFLWFYLIFVTVATAFYILYLFVFLIPVTRRYVFNPTPSVTAKFLDIERVDSALKKLRVGDAYLLYRLQSFLLHPNYYKLLMKISDPDFNNYILDKVTVFSKLQPVSSGKTPVKVKKDSSGKIGWNIK